MFSLKSTLNFPISINAITAPLITPAPDLSIISPSIPLFKSPYRVATDMTSQNSPSTFILNSSLHSSQDFRNRNQTILFACFKFPVKSKLLSWLAKPCFLSGHCPLWNSTSRAQCHSAPACSGPPSSAQWACPQGAGTAPFLQPGRLLPWSARDHDRCFCSLSIQPKATKLRELWTPDLV